MLIFAKFTVNTANTVSPRFSVNRKTGSSLNTGNR